MFHRRPFPVTMLFLALLAPVPLLSQNGGGPHHGKAAAPVPADEEVEVRGARALGPDLFVTRSGRKVSPLGMQGPRAIRGASGPGSPAERARRRLNELIAGRRLRITPRPETNDGVCHAHVRLADGRRLDRVMVGEGLAWPEVIHGADAAAAEVITAYAAARRARRGIFERLRTEPRPTPLRPIKGLSMGLYSRDPDYDYGPLLDGARDLGATHVLFIVPWFMKDWRASTLAPHPKRTAPFRTIARAVRDARRRGLRVILMPIVLLQEGTKDHWRGDIEPEDRWLWWRNYTRFMGRHADLAEALGVSILAVGSEFSSLEGDVDHWRALIRTLRLRFSGSLTYSANWDHFEEVTFWDALDLVGMTGYHSLTKSDDPSAAELENAWRAIRKRILAFQRKVSRPVFFSEVGYASQDGINKDPWNYFISDKPDESEQALCFEAFLRTWSDLPAGYAGACFYDWWRNNDADDRTSYSIAGKPAERVIRRWFRSGGTRSLGR